jgi:hypothetical protein
MRQTGKPATIIEKEKPPVVVPPISRRAAFGVMRPTLTAKIGDIVSPFDEREWEVLRD